MYTDDKVACGSGVTYIYNQPDDIHPDSLLLVFNDTTPSIDSMDRWMIVRDQAALKWLITTLIGNEIAANEDDDEPNRVTEGLKRVQDGLIETLDNNADKIWLERDYSFLEARSLKDAAEQCNTISRNVDTSFYPFLYDEISVQNWGDFFALPDTQYRLISALNYYDSGRGGAWDALEDRYLDQIIALSKTYGGLKMPGDEELIALSINIFNYSEQGEIGNLERYLEDLEYERRLEAGEE